MTQEQEEKVRLLAVEAEGIRYVLDMNSPAMRTGHPLEERQRMAAEYAIADIKLGLVERKLREAMEEASGE